MPFGAIYGALFFSVVGFWLAVAALGDGAAPFTAVKLALALLSLILGLALLLRRSWARWLGILLALFLIVFHLYTAPLSDSVGASLALFGSLVAMALLAAPAAGDVRRGLAPDRRPAPRTGRVLAAAAGLCVAGIAAGIWFGGAQTVPANGSQATSAFPAIGRADRVRWSTFGKGLERARAEEKPILVSFVTNWCGYCSKMDRTTWKDPEVVRGTEGWVTVRVDAEEGQERDGFAGRELAQRYQVYGYPTLLMLDAAGREIARTSGYLGPGQLLNWLDDTVARAGRPDPRAPRPSAR